MYQLFQVCFYLSNVESIFPGKTKVLGWISLLILLYSLSVVVNHHCEHTSSVRVPTNPDQPTLQTLMYKSLASQLYKSNPFRSPGRKSTQRPQAVLLNLHKLLGTRFPTPTHYIDRCPSTFLYGDFQGIN